MSKRCLIIAEAGVNHNGRSDLAFELIDAAVEAKADAIKFQTFKASNLVTNNAAKAQYQQQTTNSKETQYDMLKRLELPYDLHYELIEHCNEKGIRFLSTAFDHESLIFLTKDLGLTTLKIPSGEITNAPLLLEHAYTGSNLIVSTGMANLGEIEESLGVIAFGLLGSENPSRESFKAAYVSIDGQKKLKEKVSLLHCTTEYPAPLNEINLNVIKTLECAFGLPVGYSDHSAGITVPIAAAALGSVIIEKHFTLDKSLPGPDHKASLEPVELSQMVCAIRDVETALGKSIKGPTYSEVNNLEMARKSLVAAMTINADEKFTKDNLAIKRPGGGVSPMNYWDMLGLISERDYAKDDVISYR